MTTMTTQELGQMPGSARIECVPGVVRCWRDAAGHSAFGSASAALAAFSTNAYSGNGTTKPMGATDMTSIDHPARHLAMGST